MSEWWSIEIFDGKFSADRWRDAHGSDLIESALTNGAVNWSWMRRDWGIVFQVCFADEDQWQRFRDLPVVRAALDAVPDRVNGLLIYRGRGGDAGVPSRRPKRPSAGAGALELPEPEAERIIDLATSEAPGRGAPEPAAPASRGPAPAVA